MDTVCMHDRGGTSKQWKYSKPVCKLCDGRQFTSWDNMKPGYYYTTAGKQSNYKSINICGNSL